MKFSLGDATNEYLKDTVDGRHPAPAEIHKTL